MKMIFFRHTKTRTRALSEREAVNKFGDFLLLANLTSKDQLLNIKKKLYSWLNQHNVVYPSTVLYLIGVIKWIENARNIQYFNELLLGIFL